MKLAEIAQHLHGTAAGDGSAEILCVCGIDEHHPQAITFAENAQGVAQAEAQGFAALVIPAKLQTKLPCIAVANPRAAYAELLRLFHPAKPHQPGIHPAAIVSPSAVIAPDAYVGPYAVIEDKAEIAGKAVVEAHVIVGAGSKVGRETRLLAHVLLGAGCEIGSQCLVGAHTRITAGSAVGDDVEIGARCILENCRIAPGCRIDNMVLVRRGASLAAGTILVSHSSVLEEAQTGTFSVLAAQAVIAPQTKVGNFATIGGRVFVDADIPDGQATWSGTPPLPYRDDMRRLAQRNAVPKAVQKLQEKLTAKKRAEQKNS